MNCKILVIDDDANIRELLKLCLLKENYEVITAKSGQDGLASFKIFKPDLVLLDIIMPDKDGTKVCREIREISSAPIVIISAKSEEIDKVLCLELGADDFVVKPFSAKEVSARIKTILRRTQNVVKEPDIEYIKLEHFEISLMNYQLKLKNIVIDTPPKEIELLYFLASNPNRVFTRDQLLDKIWGYDFLGGSRTVDVHVKRLRDKLDGISKEWILKTVWGVGYKFEVF
jgi:DNA-binding response OmpR family regulator